MLFDFIGSSYNCFNLGISRVNVRVAANKKSFFVFGAESRLFSSSSDTMRTKTLTERIGFGPDARLLIVHADDLGLAQAVNAAFIAGIASGLINSGSVMVPCPAFSEIAQYAKLHPDADIGVHLTLTSDQSYGWAPIAPLSRVPSLIAADGYLHRKWSAKSSVRLNEVEIELRAQIEKALEAGLCPTHFDSHEHVLQVTGGGLFDIYVRLGREYNVPTLVARSWFEAYPYLRALLTRRDVVLDRTVSINSSVAPNEWGTFYSHAVEKLSPGVTEFIIHPGHANAELEAIFSARQAWGAAWRQRDFDFFTSDQFRALLEKCNVTLITWREIVSRLNRVEKIDGN